MHRGVLLPSRKLELRRTELRSETILEDLILRRYAVCLKGRTTRRVIPVGAGEPDRRVADSLDGGAPTDVVNRRDITSRSRTRTLRKRIPLLPAYKFYRSEYPDVDGAVPSNEAPPPRDVLTTPFSFDQLNDALQCARDEMRTLRRQYDELQQLVAERLGKGKELKGSERKTTQKVVCGARTFVPRFTF
ncbi:hypothetical protein EDD15DRAFT_1727621 [Pisolithus albus]|nr:hypothetical protein EDD15DRAFT_1727621 [Pisolithus albus]